MKELTIEQKAKAYNEALEKARIWQNHLYDTNDRDYADELNYIFPELKESEDERVRKGIIKYLSYIKDRDGSYMPNNIPFDDMIAWLEKQGKRKSVDKVKSKFHKGDWVVTSYGKVNQVVTVDEDGDGFTLDDGTYFSGSWKDNYHLWTIQDAKDGDVLCLYYNNRKTFFIFKAIIGEGDYADILVHCCYTGKYQYLEPSFNGECRMHQISDGGYCLPADKEEQDILFQKMHEAGYMWDSESKQLLSLKAEPSGELKPAWSEEDDMMVEETLYFLREYQQSNRCKDENGMQNSVTCEKWLKSIKQRIERR